MRSGRIEALKSIVYQQPPHDRVVSDRGVFVRALAGYKPPVPSLYKGLLFLDSLVHGVGERFRALGQ